MSTNTKHGMLCKSDKPSIIIIINTKHGKYGLWHAQAYTHIAAESFPGSR